MRMNELRKRAIERLLKRREALQAEYDRLISEPLSYGITGSVKARNRSLEELRTEISVIDDRLSGLIEPTKVAGMSVRWPNYRHWPVPYGGIL